MARTILNGKKVAMHFWGEVVNTTTHILNHVVFRPGTKIPLMVSGITRSLQLNTLECLKVFATP